MARYFQCDPVTLLEGGYFKWAVRVAAYQYASKVEQEANEKARVKKS